MSLECRILQYFPELGNPPGELGVSRVQVNPSHQGKAAFPWILEAETAASMVWLSATPVGADTGSK